MSTPEAHRLHVLRVFLGEGDRAGNALGVFLDGRGIPETRRQAIAADLGFAETVFVDDTVGGHLRIYTPASELPFAGHPLVGTSWLLARERDPVAVLRPSAGDVATWHDDGRTWIRGRDEWCPPFDLVEMESPAAVEALDGPPPGASRLCDAWAWIDEPAGEIRCRVFAGDVGIAEDEATGSAAIRLGAALGRDLVLRQGTGSVLWVRPGPDGYVDAGGRCTLDEVREYLV